jgi:hypothetical protein
MSICSGYREKKAFKPLFNDILTLTEISAVRVHTELR